MTNSSADAVLLNKNATYLSEMHFKSEAFGYFRTLLNLTLPLSILVALIRRCCPQTLYSRAPADNVYTSADIAYTSADVICSYTDSVCRCRLRVCRCRFRLHLQIKALSADEILSADASEDFHLQMVIRMQMKLSSADDLEICR